MSNDISPTPLKRLGYQVHNRNGIDYLGVEFTVEVVG